MLKWAYDSKTGWVLRDLAPVAELVASFEHHLARKTTAQFIVDACNEKEAREEFRRMTPNYHALLDAEEAR